MEKKKTLQKTLIGVGFVFAAIAVGSFAHQWMKAKRQGSTLAQTTGVKGFIQNYAHAFESIHEKVVALHHAQEEVERLRLENAFLRSKIEAVQFNAQLKTDSTKTAVVGRVLASEHGAETARTYESIPYKIPTQLPHPQLYALGLSYFKAQEDEKAATIFTFLTNLKDDTSYLTPQNYLLGGIAWYRLDNYGLADKFFDRVLAVEETPEVLPYQAQARLWKALVAKRTHREEAAQQWIRDLVDNHPKSEEAAWVNKEGDQARKPASATPAHAESNHHEKKTEETHHH